MGPKLESILKERNIKFIENLEDFEKNICVLNKNGLEPIDISKRKLVVFDNRDFNETYLIDIVDELYHKDNELLKKYECYYCNDLETRLKYSFGFRDIIDPRPSFDFARNQIIALIKDNDTKIAIDKTFERIIAPSICSFSSAGVNAMVEQYMSCLDESSFIALMEQDDSWIDAIKEESKESDSESEQVCQA